jgi:hypothetical protein
LLDLVHSGRARHVAAQSADKPRSPFLVHQWSRNLATSLPGVGSARPHIRQNAGARGSTDDGQRVAFFTFVSVLDGTSLNVPDPSAVSLGVAVSAGVTLVS